MKSKNTTKILFLELLFLYLTKIVRAQNFTVVPKALLIVDAIRCTISFTHVNGDKDHDVIVTVLNLSGYNSKLCTNVGYGNFTKMVITTFYRVAPRLVAFTNI
ncbi:hypothetical protein FJ651_09305 [Paucihalobacter ruber]|uniref:Uncharacterized protein n=1 Tax=Paucihalobacter ruber TaxID=2567861 RepID=A0A506PHJ7_9FLAO|nr:hypothetical protein [Paucihalobacter ruber]TPV33281.1 hypothetical protein FJ651_09305 [Paucihalobacter ruber]